MSKEIDKAIAAFEKNLNISFTEMLDNATRARLGISEDRPVNLNIVRALTELAELIELDQSSDTMREHS